MEATVVVEKTESTEMDPAKAMFIKICEKMLLSPKTIEMIKNDLSGKKEEAPEEKEEEVEVEKEKSPADMVLGLRKTLGM